MIFAKGNLKPTTSQKKEIRERADESSTSLASDDFNKPDPSLNWFGSKTKEMYMYGETTDFQNTVLLKCKYVRPHKDEWVGNWPLEDGQRSANVFWILDIKPGRYLELYLDDNRHFMTNGDWVIFDDTKVTHSVFSDTQWRGAVCQLTDSSLYKDKYDAYPYNSETELADQQEDTEENSVPECCCCGTKVGLHKDGWYGYRCDSDDCIVF